LGGTNGNQNNLKEVLIPFSNILIFATPLCADVPPTVTEAQRVNFLLFKR
jgi:hypothetical protein